MTEDEIRCAIGHFGYAARVAKKAGFTGIELHGAHGYLISQFLSLLTNRRTDKWGGSLENRARFLMETLDAARAAVGSDFPIGLKLNASDFQKGGFTNADCVELTKMLNFTSLDLLELSGGSLEQPKVVGVTFKDEGADKIKDSTKKREAYFVEFAGAVKAVAKMPVMVTGGFRTVSAMIEALDGGDLDIVGLARPMIVDPEVPEKILSGKVDRAPTPEKGMNPFHMLPWLNVQIDRLADGRDADLSIEPEASVADFIAGEKAATIAYLRAHKALAPADPE